MTENIYHLYNELLELAEAQKKAFMEGRPEDAIELHERRHKIIDEIQNIDNETLSVHLPDPSTGKNVRVKKDFSGKIQVIIERILSIDKEIQTVIHSELDSIPRKLNSIQKLRAFCHNVAYLTPRH